MLAIIKINLNVMIPINQALNKDITVSKKRFPYLTCIFFVDFKVKCLLLILILCS